MTFTKNNIQEWFSYMFKESADILYDEWMKEHEIYVLTPNGKVERVR